jgi:hypothetical protein
MIINAKIIVIKLINTKIYKFYYKYIKGQNEKDSKFSGTFGDDK